MDQWTQTNTYLTRFSHSFLLANISQLHLLGMISEDGSMLVTSAKENIFLFVCLFYMEGQGKRHRKVETVVGDNGLLVTVPSACPGC